MGRVVRQRLSTVGLGRIVFETIFGELFEEGAAEACF